jgi:amidohydrolase
MLKEKVQQLVNELHPKLIEIRHHLHQYPELSFEEKETSRFVADRLKEWGIPFTEGVGGYGIVGMIEGGKGPGPVIALRADMDALPIQEENEVPYRSKNEGVMHACGHDVHTTSLLGASYILQQLRNEFKGTIKLIYQPAEERLPSGANAMIAEGVLENPRPDVIIGQHVHPPLQAGKIGMKGGMYMASADEIYVRVTGKGGHAALPKDFIDPILISAHLLVALQQIVSRRANPGTPSVLSFGKIESNGGATNIIPNEVHFRGTFRTMDEEWRAEAHQLMKDLAVGLARSMGGDCEFEVRKGTPFLKNDLEITQRAQEAAADFLGADRVVELPIRMTGEDFAFYTQKVPALFYRLGTGNPEKGITSPVHTTTFDIDEESLKYGSGVMAWIALEFLNDAE